MFITSELEPDLFFVKFWYDLFEICWLFTPSAEVGFYQNWSTNYWRVSQPPPLNNKKFEIFTHLLIFLSIYMIYCNPINISEPLISREP